MHKGLPTVEALSTRLRHPIDVLVPHVYLVLGRQNGCGVFRLSVPFTRSFRGRDVDRRRRNGVVVLVSICRRYPKLPCRAGRTTSSFFGAREGTGDATWST